jgi:hypothetical protein
MIRRYVAAFAAATALIGLVAFVPVADAGVTTTARTRVFTVALDGFQEAPGPGDLDGFGLARITINPATDQICSVLIVGNIQRSFAAHIHEAPIGVPGPIRVFLPNPATGRAAGCTTSPDFADAIANNPANFYVNVHTPDHPGGAIRGQLAFPPNSPI